MKKTELKLQTYFQDLLIKKGMFLDGFYDNLQLEYMLDQLSLRWTKRSWAESMGVFNVKFPYNWIQAFKDRFFKGWLRRKFPIKYKIINLEAAMVFPNYKPSLDLQDPGSFPHIQPLETVSSPRVIKIEEVEKQLDDIKEKYHGESGNFDED